jgi:response regulator NasT
MAANVRVLLVEDEFLILRAITEQLAKLGCEVVGTARSGPAAVEAALRLKPDVLLMDIGLPEMDGIEACRRIMACLPLPIVVLSAYDDQNRLQEAKAAGAVGYLIKPIRESQLKKAIEEALSNECATETRDSET